MCFCKKVESVGVFFVKKKVDFNAGCIMYSISIFILLIGGAYAPPAYWPVPSLYSQPARPPLKCPFLWGDLEPHLVQGFLGLLESAHQTASRSVRPFLHRPRYIDR